MASQAKREAIAKCCMHIQLARQSWPQALSFFYNSNTETWMLSRLLQARKDRFKPA